MGVAQSVRAPDCGSGGRRFESGRPPWGTTGGGGNAHGRTRGSALAKQRLTPRPDFPTIKVYRVSPGPSRSAAGFASPADQRRAAPVFGRLRPPLIFDNRGHEKRAGPSPASTVSRRFSFGPASAGRTRGFNQRRFRTPDPAGSEVRQSYLKLSIMESLILAQDERWRRA